MPKRKKAPTKQKQKQSQRQSVVVNIGASKGKSKPRKSSGRGGLPPPSYQHNLAPTFITAPQVDYAPIIGAIAGLTAKIQQEPRIQNPITPLSSSVQATQTATPQGNAQALAGEAALRRAGKTAGNFQSQASQVRMDEAPIPPAPPLQRTTSAPPLVRPPDMPFMDIIQKSEDIGSGGGVPFAESEVVKRGRGRPPKNITRGVPTGGAAEEPLPSAKQVGQEKKLGAKTKRQKAFDEAEQLKKAGKLKSLVETFKGKKEK
jgi:hypothetical protein